MRARRAHFNDARNLQKSRVSFVTFRWDWIFRVSSCFHAQKQTVSRSSSSMVGRSVGERESASSPSGTDPNLALEGQSWQREYEQSGVRSVFLSANDSAFRIWDVDVLSLGSEGTRGPVMYVRCTKNRNPPRLLFLRVRQGHLCFPFVSTLTFLFRLALLPLPSSRETSKSHLVVGSVCHRRNGLAQHQHQLRLLVSASLFKIRSFLRRQQLWSGAVRSGLGSD
jgi:hypothetical protein